MLRHDRQQRLNGHRHRLYAKVRHQEVINEQTEGGYGLVGGQQDHVEDVRLIGDL